MKANELKIGVVGAGDMGSSVAKLAAQAGFEVFLSNSRGPQSLSSLSAELGPNAHAVTVEQAVALGDIIVISIPFSKFLDLPLEKFGSQKIVIDAMNFIPFRDASVEHLLGEGRNPSQLLQDKLNGAKVVKSFSNIYAGHLYKLSRPSGSNQRSALPIAGDDEPAKKQVMDFLDQIGWDALDAGTLESTPLFDVGTPSFVKAYMINSQGSGEEWGARISSDPGRTLTKEQLSELLAEKTR